MDPGIASVSCVTERLESRENSSDNCASPSHNLVTDQRNQNNVQTHLGNPPNESNTAAIAASSASN